MDSIDLQQFLDDQAIEAEIVYLTVETPTVEAAAAGVGCQPEQIGKSLLFLADGTPHLVIANGTTRVGYKALADHLAISRKRLKMASAGQVLDITGFQVGTVPPFGHKMRLPTIIESQVMAQDVVYAGGGDINALMRLTTDELLRVSAGMIVSLPHPSDQQ